MVRDANGRFARNHIPAQPNRAAATGVLTRLDLHQHVRDIANLPVILRDGRGRRRIVSMFEAAVWRIATGQVSRRMSPVWFVRLALESANAWPPDHVPAPLMPADGFDGRHGTRATGAVDFDTALATHATILERLIRSRRRT